MSLDIFDLGIILIGAVIGVVALAVLRIEAKSDSKKNYKKYSSILLIGKSWFIIGALLEIIYRDESVLDTTLFSLGFILLLAGGLGIILEYPKNNKV
jgi:predicted membrane channel-forming protein YqfA (hemolysin III family)